MGDSNIFKNFRLLLISICKLSHKLCKKSQFKYLMKDVATILCTQYLWRNSVCTNPNFNQLIKTYKKTFILSNFWADYQILIIANGELVLILFWLMLSAISTASAISSDLFAWSTCLINLPKSYIFWFRLHCRWCMYSTN